MYLFVHFVRSVAATKETDVVQPVVFDQRHAPGNDIDVVADRQVDEAVQHLVRIFRQLADRLRLAHVVELSHQRGIEVFGEKDEVTLIVRYGIHEKFHLFEHVIEPLVRSHLPLDKTDADGRLGRNDFRSRLVIDIVPLQQGCIMFGFLIVRQIIRHHFTNMEIIRYLKSQHRIINFSFTDLINIFLRAHRIRIFMIIRDTSAEHNRFQVQAFTQFLPIIIHTPCQTQAPVIGMDKDLYSIQDIAFWIMRIKGFVSSNKGVSMVVLYLVVIDDDRQGAPHDLIIHDRNHLPFRENSD